MKLSWVNGMRYLPVAAAVVAVIALFWWILWDPTGSWTESVPGKDAASDSTAVSETINIGEFFKRMGQETSALSGTWTRFRGANSDNSKQSEVPLIDRFSGSKAKVCWEVELGEGHSGAAIYNGLVYVLDYDEAIKADMLRCFSLVSGKEQWRRWYTIQVKRNHGMSRTVPAVTDKSIVTMGPRGHVMCVDRATGDFKWGIDLVKEYGTEVPLWYTGQCPLIENEVAILAPGGKSLIIGVDCATGKVLWETPNPDKWGMSHSSVMPYVFKGRKMYVYAAVGGMCGVVADGPDAGKLLWKTSAFNKSVVAPSPVCMPDGKIFMTAGYGAGSMQFQLKEEGGTYSIEKLMTLKPGDGLACEQQTPLLLDGFMIGIMPKDGKTLRNQLVCVKASDPTKVVWKSGSDTQFGLGPYMLVDDKLFILNDDATLHIVRKSVSGYEPLDKVKLFDGADAWAPLAVADGYMVLRDATKLMCIDLRR